MKRFITIAATLFLAAVTFAQGTGVLRYWKDVDRAPGKERKYSAFPWTVTSTQRHGTGCQT